MARNTKSLTISAEGRDKGKTFLLTEMSAVRAEKWAARAVLALLKSGVELPEDAAQAGLAGIADQRTGQHAGRRCGHRNLEYRAPRGPQDAHQRQASGVHRGGRRHRHLERGTPRGPQGQGHRSSGLILSASACGRPVRPLDVDLRWVGAMLFKNGVIEETGLAAGVLNHPANGVAWLANKIAPYGEQLHAGDIVLGGSFTRPTAAAQGDTFHADYGPLGGIDLMFV